MTQHSGQANSTLCPHQGAAHDSRAHSATKVGCKWHDGSLSKLRNFKKQPKAMPYRADCLELGTISWAIVLGVVAEDSGTVEWAVILRVVQPALEAVRALTTETNTNNVRRAANSSNADQ